MKKIKLLLGMFICFVIFSGCSKEGKVVETEVIDVVIQEVNLSKDEDFTYYDMDVQEEIDEQIEELKSENEYTIKNPLVMINPYGTNTTGLYVYFNADEEGSVEYTISVEGYNDFSNTLNNGEENNLSLEHEYQLIGLIPDEINTILLTYKDADGNEVSKVSFEVEAPSLASGYITQVEKIEGTSDCELEDGLYYTFGLNYTYNGYSFLLDNEGVVRAEYVLEADMSENLIQVEDCMFYSVNLSKAVLVNRLGQVENVYEFEDYEIHHDYALNDNNEMICLATEYAKSTVEDVIISIDLESGEITELIDFDDVMADYKALTYYYGEESVFSSDEWDWLHFNSIQLVGEDSMILSSRETSTIMKFSNIYDTVTIDYFIGEDTMWANTGYEDYLLDMVGEFKNSAGQHNVTYVEDESLEDGQYYLYFYDNNWSCCDSRISEVADTVGASLSFFDDGASSSYYRCYLVDENEGTYELVDSLEVPYSSIVSSVQWVDENLIVNSGMQKQFNVYDKEGNVIATYNYNDSEESIFLGYRIYKYDFVNYYFS